MLSTLHIENIAVIEQAEIAFDSGFNVLTGETGAGKSIVIDAISAILGERASREMIRTGAQKAFVSAIFSGVPELPWFAENQIPYEPELGISREIFADGKNSCRVSGKPVTVSTLRKLGVQLIQIHGQNDSQQLFDEATHIGYLDLYAHDEALLADYRQAYDKVSVVQQEIRRLSMDESEKLRLVETLKFQIDEIERAELQSGEEDELLERRKVLQNAEKLTDAMESAVSALYGDETSDGAAAMIANAAQGISGYAAFDRLLSGSDGIYVWGRAGLYKRSGNTLEQIVAEPVLDFCWYGDNTLYYLSWDDTKQIPAYYCSAAYFPCASSVMKLENPGQNAVRTILAERDESSPMQNLTDIYVEYGTLYVAGSYCMGIGDLHAALYEVKDGKLTALFGEY